MKPVCADASIGDQDTLLRRTAESFVVYDENLHRLRPSTQAFKQSELSVYLSSQTTPEAVISEGAEPYMVSIKVGLLSELGLDIVMDPSSGGPGHCLVTGPRTKGKLNQIVKNTEWVVGYALPQKPT